MQIDKRVITVIDGYQKEKNKKQGINPDRKYILVSDQEDRRNNDESNLMTKEDNV